MTVYKKTTTTTATNWFFTHTPSSPTTVTVACSSSSSSFSDSDSDSTKTGTATPTIVTVTATATVTQALRCAPQNLISSHDNFAVRVQWADLPWAKGWLAPRSGFNNNLLQEASRDPSVCCQICVDNSPGGCVASEWVPNNWWNPIDACRLYYFVGNVKTGTTAAAAAAMTCADLEYFADAEKFPGMGSFLQQSGGSCGGLKYMGVL